MEVSGKLRQCPTLNALCRRCLNSSCTCSKMILSCGCVSVVHEECLIKEIKSKPQFVSPSQAHPGYNEYRCRTCKKSVLYRPDFSNSCIPCSSYTTNETYLWIYFPILYLFFFGGIGFLIYLAIDSSLIGLYIALIVFFFVSGDILDLDPL